VVYVHVVAQSNGGFPFTDVLIDVADPQVGNGCHAADLPVLRHLPQPLDAGVLVGRIGLAGSDIDPARDGLVDGRPPLLLQKVDQPLLRPDVAPDPTVGVVKETGDGGLLGERRKGDSQILEVAGVDVHHCNASSHTSLLGSRLPTISTPTDELGVNVDSGTKDDHIAAANRRSSDEIDGRLPDFFQGLTRPGEQNITVANGRVCSGAVRSDAGLALRDVEPVSGV